MDAQQSSVASGRGAIRTFGAITTAVAVTVLVGTWYERAPHVQAAAPQAVVAPRPGLAPDGYAELIARVAPSVVTIRSVRTVHQTGMPFDQDFMHRFFGEQGGARPAPRREGGLGSGVVVSADGYVLTNHHVVERAEKVRVDLADGRSFDARVVGTDQPSDLALLKIPATGLAPIGFGDSDRTRVGDVVLAIGNPLGIGQTVTMGIVSAKGRAPGAGDGSFEDFIQTDAPINQGNSGGALIDTRGELVGINSQILSPVGYNIGIGFAIPVNMARGVMEQLMSSGAVKRGMLGVTVQQMTADLAQGLGLSEVRGAVVTDVTPDGPAARAGIAQGDVILALNGKPVDSSNSLRNHVAPLGPGAKVRLTVRHDGRDRELDATLAELPSAKAPGGTRGVPQEEQGRFGLALENLTPDVARELGVATSRGVVIADVDPDGRAAEAGLASGDVIEQVNGKVVTTVAEAKSALTSSDASRPVLLLVNRQGSRVFVTIPADRN